MNLSIFKVFAAVLLGSTPSLAKDRPDRSMLHVGNTDFPSPVFNPTPKPTSPCTGNTPGWVDVDGYGCEWWEAVDAPGCPKYGNEFEGSMGTANDNCCYCEGTGVSKFRVFSLMTNNVISQQHLPFLFNHSRLLW